MDDPIESHQLRSIVERIERLEEEKKTIADDIKEVYAEAKGNGYDVKVLRKLIALRRRDSNERAEEEAVLDLYEQALGDLADTPLGRAAAPGFASRAPMARSTETHSERVSHAAQRQNPSGAEAGSAVRVGAPVSEIEHQPARLSAERDPQSVQHGSDSEGGAGGESPHSLTGSGQGSAAETQARNEPGSEGIASGGAGVTARPETPTRKPFVLRPHCQRPEMCGSYGSKHCGGCERLAKSGEDEEASTIPAFVRKTHDHSAMGEQA